MHSCNVVGNRQMISIDGRVNNASEYNLDNSDSNPDSSLPDPWPHGIGIFDMTTMQWKTSYDPNAAPYKTPNAIKAYYEQNGQYPSSWTNDVVKDWFTNPGMDKINTTNTTSTTDDSSQDNSTSPVSSPSATSHSGSSGTNKGAIAGSVVGRVAAVALIAFLLRPRNRNHSQVPLSRSEMRGPELGRAGPTETGDPASEMVPREVPANELPTKQGHRVAYHWRLANPPIMPFIPNC